MAKRKLSARQKAARKHKAYLRAEYYKNYDALEYLRNFMDIKQVLIPKEITEVSVRYIRRIYKEARSNLKEYNKEGYVNILTGEQMLKAPTMREMAKQIREKYPEREYRIQRPKKPKIGIPPTPEPENPDETYLEELKQKILDAEMAEETAKTQRNIDKNVTPKLNNAKLQWINAIDNAINLYGAEQVAQSLAANKYMERIENLEMKYAYELIESVKDYGEGTNLLYEASVNVALEDLVEA